MRRLLIILIALTFPGVSYCFGQDKNAAIPLRLQALTKNEHFRLLRVLGTPEMPATFHQASAMSADGKRALYVEDLSTGAEDQPRLRSRLLLWDLQAKTWPREISIDGESVTAICISSDGSKALVAGQFYVESAKEKVQAKNYRSTLALWDLNVGAKIQSVVLDKSDVLTCVALSSDGTVALAGSTEGVVGWNVKQSKSSTLYQKKGLANVTALTFLPGGKQFLASYRSGEVLLWDVAEQEPERSYLSPKDAGFVWHLAVSRDGKRFLSGNSQSSTTLWDIEAGKAISTFQPAKSPIELVVTAIALADDGKTVFACWSHANPDPDDSGATRLEAWDSETKKIIWSKSTPYRGCVPLLTQGERLLAGGGPNLLDVWTIKDGKLLESSGGHKGTINALTSLPNGDLVSAGQEGVLMTWRQGQLANKHTAHAGPIGVLAMSPDQKQWLSAGADRMVKLWTSGADKPMHVLKGHAAPVTSIAFGKEGRWAASGSADRSVRTWDLLTGKEIASITGHADAVHAVAISPDDLWLASAGDDAIIRVTPIKDGKPDPDRDVLILEHHKKAVTCLAFSPDGKTLLSGSKDHTLKVWDWAKEKVVRTIPGHKNWITSLLFIDEASVLTTSDDLSLCWWELASGKEIGRIDFGAVGDCPRCVTRVGPDRIAVGSSSWLLYEFQMTLAPQSKKAP